MPRPSPVPQQPHDRVRRVAYLCLLAIGAVVLITEIVLLAHGEAPFIAYLAVLIPAGVAAGPLAFIVTRLKDGQDRLALAAALAYPLAVLAALLLAAIRMWTGTTEDQMDLFALVVFFFADPVWAVFVVGFLPLLVRLGLVALRAIRTGSEGVPGVPLLLGATLILLAGYQVVWRPLTETPRLQPTGLWHFNVRYLVDGGHEPGQGPMQGDLAFERMRDL